MNRLITIACLGIGFLTGIAFLRLLEDRSFMVDETKDKPTLVSGLSLENSPQNNYSAVHYTTKNSEALSEIEPCKAIIVALQSTIATLQSKIRENETSQINTDTERAVNPYMDNRLSMDENKSSMDENELRLSQVEEEYQFFPQLANNFYSEPIDYSWSRSMIDRITSALNSEAVSGLNSNYIECRSSMCRLEIAITNSSVDLEAFKQNFLNQISDVLTSSTIQQDDTGKVTIYLGRDNEVFTRTP